MGKKGDKAVDELIDAFRVLVVAAIVIYAGYAIIESLIKNIPLWIELVLALLLVAFVYAVRDKVLQFIKGITK